MQEIGTKLLRQQYQKLADSEDVPGTRERLGLLEEEISLDKFIAFGDETGLYELGERESLSPDTIHKLLEYAAQYKPSDRVFQQIIAVVNSAISKSTDDG
jgi:hypothetical protein